MEASIESNNSVGRLGDIKFSQKTACSVQVGLGHSRDRPLQGLRLDETPQLRNLPGLLCRQQSDTDSTTRFGLEEPFGCELLERFADDHLAHAKTRGDRVLRKAVAPVQPLLEDAIPECVRHDRSGRAAFDCFVLQSFKRR